jgi:glutathione-regulated potassium-efflux system ancillary protein KefG
MHTLIITAHPNLEQSRINKAMLAAAAEADIHIHDLYAVYPDERIKVEEEQRLMEKADRIVLQFPFYWYSAPSLMKKWIDSVMTYGWAYGAEGRALAGKKLLIATSTGGPEEAYQAGGYNRYPMAELLRPYQAMANLTQLVFEEPFVIHGVRTLSDSELHERTTAYVRQLLAE